jgi:hypothetical protein
MVTCLMPGATETDFFERGDMLGTAELTCEHQPEAARSAGDDYRFAAEVIGAPRSLRTDGDRCREASGHEGRQSSAR